MKQVRIVMVLLAMMGLLVACNKNGTHGADPKKLVDSRHVTAGTFSKIEANGPFDIELLAGINEHDVRVLGTRHDIYRVRVKIEDDTLILSMLPGELSHDQRLLAVIRVNQLHDLTYAGSGNVKAIGLNAPWFNAHLKATGRVSLDAKRLHLRNLDLKGSGLITLKHVDSDDLTINSQGNDKVYLHGETSLRKLTVSGKSWLKAIWIDSPSLTIHGSKKSYVELSGIAGTLDVKLDDQAHFNGRFLRTQRCYVKTYGNARADLQVVKIQNTLASQHSNIYFYKRSIFPGTHMAQSGAVLDLNGMR